MIYCIYLFTIELKRIYHTNDNQKSDGALYQTMGYLHKQSLGNHRWW